MVDNLEDVISIYTHEEKKAVQDGQEDVNPSLTDRDYLHIFGTIVAIYPNGIPNSVFQDFTRLLLAFMLGR